VRTPSTRYYRTSKVTNGAALRIHGQIHNGAGSHSQIPFDVDLSNTQCKFLAILECRGGVESCCLVYGVLSGLLMLHCLQNL